MVLNRLLRAGETRTVKRLGKIADYVDTFADEIAELTDAELRAKTDEFRERYADGESLDDLLPEAFAVVREAASRTLGQFHYPVQLMGGAALHEGNVAEMRTGEGKTLVSTLPAYLNAIAQEGVHVVTVNDYLAQRDSQWMGRVHRFLGLEVGAIFAGMPAADRRAAYEADITYGTNNEFGFDFLRDNMAWSKAECVQRGHTFAIVDEVDSILIDEARTPLIISGPAEQSARWYTEFARLAPKMTKDVHYEVDERKKTIGVTEDGVSFIEDQLGIDNLYEAANTPLVGYLNNAIKVKELFLRDKDYIVRDGEVLIVDEFTGRVLVGRRYNEGLHQAIEAKEGVEIKPENQTLATITLQNYFRQYEKLCGMTGTAQTEAAELSKTYKLGVVSIPTNKPPRRVDQADLVYKTEPAKFEAVADDVAEHFERGQPVLIGTTSVERSEYLAKLLTSRGVEHSVLNAKFHEQEAQIIAEAGRRGSVTVATNMAGRGTDIVLGGNPDFIADQRLRAKGLDPVDSREEYEAAWDETLAEVKDEVSREAVDVKEAGGLYVLGTERHESRRIDNQLRGRSGRQGDPGESRFYLSLGDELMRRFNGAMVESIMTRFNLPEDMPIEAKMVSRAIRSAQTQVEQQNFEARKDILEYDEVMNQQRTVIYAERHRVLEGENLSEQVQNMIVDTVDGLRRRRDVRGLQRGLGPREALDGPGPALPRRGPLAGPRRGAGGHRPRHAGRAPHRGRAGGLRQARGRDRRHRAPGRDARARAAGRPVGARPQVARAPLRDGLPQAGHRPAGDGPARSQDRVQARGLRDVHLHDGGHPRGVRRVPVQPDHPGRGAGPRRRRARSEPDDGHQRPGGDHPGHPGPAHQPDADHLRRRAAARRPAGGRRADQRDPGAAARTRRPGPTARRGPVGGAGRAWPSGSRARAGVAASRRWPAQRPAGRPALGGALRPGGGRPAHGLRSGAVPAGAGVGARRLPGCGARRPSPAAAGLHRARRGRPGGPARGGGLGRQRRPRQPAAGPSCRHPVAQRALPLRLGPQVQAVSRGAAPDPGLEAPRASGPEG